MIDIIPFHSTADEALEQIMTAIGCLERFEREHPTVAHFARELQCAQLHLWAAALTLTLDDEGGTN